MKINKEIKEIMENKYKEMKGKNLSEDYLNKGIFGDLMVFINKKPKYSLFSIEIDSDNVYFGSELM